MKRSWLVVLAGMVGACHASFDDTRVPVDNGSFGTTVLTLACKRVAYLDEVEAYEAGESATIDVAGDKVRAICRDGSAPPTGSGPALFALQAKRTDLVAATDALFPENFLGDLQTFLTSNEFLGLYDDGTTIASIDKLIELLDLFADDPEMAPALERLNHRLGYMPLPPSLGTMRAVVAYPEMHDFLLTFTNAITVGGSARQEFDNMIAASSIAMRNAEISEDADSPERTGALAIDLLFTESPLLGTSKSLPIVRRDNRGLAIVQLADGSFPEPFADMNDDGEADADDMGRFTDATGVPFIAPSPFALAPGEEQSPVPNSGVPGVWPYRDEDGRALAAPDGPPLYDYVDLDNTVLAALTRDALKLFDPAKGTALDLLRGSSLLVGPRVMQTREYADGSSIDYRGYDTANSPLLDMVHAYLVLLTDPNVYDVLELSRRLLADHEPEAARLFEAMVDTARTADMFPDAQLIPGSPIYDDLMPVVIEILETPGLAEDLLRALESPEVAELGLRLADHMTYKDRFDIDPNTQEVIGSFSTEVDRNAVDSNYNRSLMQRLLHLINNSSGAVLCNKQNAVVKDPFIGITLATYDECELLQIDDLAVFYVQSIAYAKDASGNVIIDDVHGVPTPRRKARFPFEFNNILIEAVVNDDLLEEESTIEGFRFHPTPEALNRSMLLDPMPAFLADAMDPAEDREGNRYIDAHAGTLPVWEMDGFYDQIRPVVQAFADHDAEYLFVDVLKVLHNHYPSADSTNHQQSNPNGAAYAFASEANTYEPLLAEILRDRKLMDALVFNAPVLNNINVNGKPATRVMVDAGRFILSPQPGLAKRTGETTTFTEDGREVSTLSPWYVLADALKSKRAMIADSASEGAAWVGAVSNTVDVLIRGDAVVGEGFRFRNPRFRGISLAVIDFLESRIAAHDNAGDRVEWLTVDLPTRLEDTVTSPVFAGAADFIVSLQADPDARRQLENLVAYLVDEVAHSDAFWTSLSSAADMLQFALDDRDIVPIFRVAGEALRPERGILTAHLDFAKAARASDEGQALVTIVRNLFVEHRPGHTVIGDLIDGITEVHRARPYDDLGQPYTAADYRSAFRATAAFLGEERRGLRKFIQIIQSRNL